MKTNRKNALHLWEERYGISLWEKDFHGNWMYKDAYGDDEAWAYANGNFHPVYSNANSYFYSVLTRNKICCGWNIHHILPKVNRGTNEKLNLICTNIATNHEAKDKTTFWIDNCNYQVQRVAGTREHKIVRLNPSTNQTFMKRETYVDGYYSALVFERSNR